MTFSEGKSDEAVSDKIVSVFTDLQEGPVEDFRDPKLIRAFANINNSVFPINVIATMSSGKSTLINALLGKKMMPSKNEACTATISPSAGEPCIWAIAPENTHGWKRRSDSSRPFFSIILIIFQNFILDGHA